MRTQREGQNSDPSTEDSTHSPHDLAERELLGPRDANRFAREAALDKRSFDDRGQILNRQGTDGRVTASEQSENRKSVQRAAQVIE